MVLTQVEEQVLESEGSYREVMGFPTTRKAQYAESPLPLKQEGHLEPWEIRNYPSVQEGDVTAWEAGLSAYFLIVHNSFPLPPLAFNSIRFRRTNLGRGQTWLYPRCPDSSVPLQLFVSDSLFES